MRWIALLLLLCPPAIADEADIDLDAVSAAQPTVEDFGYWLGRLDESEKSMAMNVLVDLTSDSHLDRKVVSEVLRRLLDEGPPPEDFGYRCTNCFQRRLSALLQPLRMKGPRVNGPVEGIIVLKLDQGFLRKLTPEAREEIGDSLPGAVKALLAGWSPKGKFSRWAYARYHEKGGDVMHEPAFFTDAAALAKLEEGRREPLDAWALTRWLSMRPPRNSFEPGFLVLSFDPSRSCKEVRIPTAADTEQPEFRPTPASEKVSGFAEGGAPQWVCPNFPLIEATRVRYVPHSSYLEG